jgi:enoyl-[acyl-carrier protein] reductase/trans-2-enoyl-CoA reductase (NAD+)
LQEGTIEQQNRLFRQHLYRQDGMPSVTDEQDRLRLDDWELRDDVQRSCKESWPRVTDETLFDITDYAGYKRSFLRLFGFARPDVDYEIDVPSSVAFDCVEL